MIQPSVSFHMNSWNLPRWQETIIHRLRLDMYNKLNNFKHKIGHHPNGMCDTCNVYDNVNHLFTSCIIYTNNRHKLQRALKYTNNQMTIHDIFGSKNNITYILQFIKESLGKY